MRRKRIGVLYQNMEHWMGGTYYIQNLVSALNLIAEENRPEIVIFCKTDEEFHQMKGTNYNYLSKRRLWNYSTGLGIGKRIINKIANKFTGFDIYSQPVKMETEDLDVFFPSPVGLLLQQNQKSIYWIPDFQEKYYPNFFSSTDIKSRTQNHRFIANSNNIVVFSSENAESDFKRFFPKYRCKTYVLRFAVTHPFSYSELDVSVLKTKFNIDRPYFFAPNQFWKHKNQQVILKAVYALKNQGITNFMVAFSGKEHDYRNPDYVEGLKIFVKEKQLEGQVRFLGFIDREEQLKLMSEAIAIIQPSLFEGWSTVVEDAKAMDQWVIASDLAVHKEQLKQNVSFFSPEDDKTLAILLKKGIEEGFEKKALNYYGLIQKFGMDFINLVND